MNNFNDLKYVKINTDNINEISISKPMDLSLSQQDSPNVFWKKEQMKLHGYYLVDISYNQNIEDIDLEHPLFKNDEVKYNRIPKSEQEVLIINKDNKIKELKESFFTEIEKTYDYKYLLLVSLDILDNQETTKIKTEIKNKKLLLDDLINLVKKEKTVDNINQIKWGL
jgi:hypothetical protein